MKARDPNASDSDRPNPKCDIILQRGSLKLNPTKLHLGTSITETSPFSTRAIEYPLLPLESLTKSEVPYPLIMMP